MKHDSYLYKLIFFLCILINNTIGDVPNFISGFGLTVCSFQQLNTRLYEVIVSSNEVRGNQTISILLPEDYSTSRPQRHYPVLYLLHGAHQNATSWITDGQVQNTTGNVSLITVMPNGDPVGFYTNWVFPEDFAPQNWQIFHMEQLVPWIDLNLRTISKKHGRAIAGLSMGGYGAIHYAELYSNYFIYAASFSGPLDLLDTNVQYKILNLTSIDGKPISAAFGDPQAPLSSNSWFTQSTITRVAELHDISIALYNGNKGYPESIYRNGFYQLRDLLILFQIPVYFDDYGDGQSIGHGCDGAHDWFCFRASFIDVLPRIMIVLEQQSF